MQAVQFAKPGTPTAVLRVVEVETPQPARGEVRVRMLASPINPSDLMFVEGTYGQQPVLPATPGFEGVGVVEAGGGVLGRMLTGQRVAVLNRRGGNWAEQVVVPAKQVVPIGRSLPQEQAATFFVNPLTAVVLTERVCRLQRGEWLLQSAAGSSLGRMVIRLGRTNGFRTLNIVRRADQVSELKALGAHEVLVFDAATDDPEVLIAEVLDRTGGVRCAIDPVGGTAGSALVRCLRERGRLVVFGSLSGQPLQVSPRTLLTSRVMIEGFWLGPWMLSQPLPTKLRLIRRVRRLIEQGVLRTDVGATFPLTEVRAAVEAAMAPERSGKVLIQMRS